MKFHSSSLVLLNILTRVVIYRNFDLRNDIISMRDFFKKKTLYFCRCYSPLDLKSTFLV